MQKFLDLDAIAPAVALTVQIHGETHTMRPTTVATFVELMRDIENHGINGTASAEIAIMVKLLKSAFPTMTDETITTMNIDQMRVLRDWTMQAGAGKVEKVEEDDAGNAPTAS